MANHVYTLHRVSLNTKISPDGELLFLCEVIDNCGEHVMMYLTDDEIAQGGTDE